MVPDAAPRRYLWTDAYAVHACLALHRRLPDDEWLAAALRLVDQVHRVLGRHRSDDARSGWISGLDEAEGARHPAVGGLRIGKPLPERTPRDPLDPGLEWDRDGQYFHYLTRWIGALDAVAIAVPDGPYARWATELVHTAVTRFLARDAHGRSRGLYWKMSIALDRPLVPSTGQHDPLDGLATLAGLAGVGRGAIEHPLAGEISVLVELCRVGSWASDDALGIGGLVSATCRLARIRAADGPAAHLVPGSILERANRDAERSLRRLDVATFENAPAERRLAFRELGLAIGLGEVERLAALPDGHRHVESEEGPIQRVRQALERWTPLRRTILDFWLEPRRRTVRSWTDHGDINGVMLAAALLPD